MGIGQQSVEKQVSISEADYMVEWAHHTGRFAPSVWC